jgi:hypothetical protein
VYPFYDGGDKYDVVVGFSSIRLMKASALPVKLKQSSSKQENFRENDWMPFVSFFPYFE